MNDKAISPVIGVMLMVCITVILAAVIAAFIFGMSDFAYKTPVVCKEAPLIEKTIRVVEKEPEGILDEFGYGYHTNGEYFRFGRSYDIKYYIDQNGERNIVYFKMVSTFNPYAAVPIPYGGYE